MKTYQSIVECIAKHAYTQPDKLCLADSKKALTYAEIWSNIYGLSQHFTESGIKKGDCIVIECTQNVDYMICEFAIQLSGAVFVPLEKNAALSRVEEITSDVDCKLYIGKKPVIEGLPFLDIKTVPEFSMPVPESVKTVTFPAADDTAEILFSTGTTGKSKGIELSHMNDFALAENVKYGTKMKENNVELIPMPLSHSHGLRRTYGNMLNGSSVVFSNGVTLLKQVFDLMDKYSVTSMDLSPSNLSIIFKLSGDRLGDYADVMDYIQLGSAPLPETDKEHLARILPETRLYNFYGSTEAGCSCLLDFNATSGKKGCIGKPAVNADFIVVDENRNDITATATADEPGFLASSGAINMKGYWKAPELTEEAMADGFIYTKDLGYIDEEGYIYMLGRKDDVINYGGVKIAPEEIEGQVNKHPAIADCACIPVKDELTGQAPKLFIAIKAEADYDAKEFRAFLKTALDANKQPKIIEIIDEIPRTFNGKIQRKKLMEM